jgi:AcrR family transcriptional regulator
MATGLRERHKGEARRAISGAAMSLFSERGFDEVTIAQVADAAGVSKMTVTNYFPRKEDLVFDRADEIIASLAAAVAGRSPGESLLAAIRRDYASRLAAGDAVPTAAFARLVAGSHVLTGRLREIADLREQALGDALAAADPLGADPLGADPLGADGALGAGDVLGADGVRRRIVAAQLASVHRVLFAEATRRVLAGQPRSSIEASLLAAAGEAFDLLESSLGDYGAGA